MKNVSVVLVLAMVMSAGCATIPNDEQEDRLQEFVLDSIQMSGGSPIAFIRNKGGRTYFATEGTTFENRFTVVNIDVDKQTVELRDIETNKVVTLSVKEDIVTQPNANEDSMRKNEVSAIAALRTISMAQIQFQASGFADADADNVGDYGPLNGATSLANPAAGTAPFIDQVLATGIKSGYAFMIGVDNAGDGDETYTCIARPAKYGLTGVRSFFVDKTGVIRYETANVRPTAKSTPLFWPFNRQGRK